MTPRHCSNRDARRVGVNLRNASFGMWLNGLGAVLVLSSGAGIVAGRGVAVTTRRDGCRECEIARAPHKHRGRAPGQQSGRADRSDFDASLMIRCLLCRRRAAWFISRSMPRRSDRESLGRRRRTFSLLTTTSRMVLRRVVTRLHAAACSCRPGRNLHTAHGGGPMENSSW